MKQSTYAVQFILLVCSIALVLSACSAAPPPPQPTVTPLPSPTAVAVEPPTAEPTALVIDNIPEVIEARQKLLEGNYDRAAQLLVRANTAYPNTPELQEFLATTYRDWGNNLIVDSQGQTAQVALALEKFASGLVIVPQGSTIQQQLQVSDENARAYLAAVAEYDALNAQLAAGSLEVATRQRETERVAELFASLHAKRSGIPGITERYAEVLLEAGKSYREGGESKAERIAWREKAKAYCEQAISVAPELAEAQTCIDDSVAAIEELNRPEPTITPTKPTVVVKPKRLYVSKKGQFDQAGCMSMQIVGVNAAGWTLSIDGLNLGATFDGGGNARLCGLPGNAVTFTIRSGGAAVAGGSGIPAIGTDIFIGEWR